MVVCCQVIWWQFNLAKWALAVRAIVLNELQISRNCNVLINENALVNFDPKNIIAHPDAHHAHRNGATFVFLNLRNVNGFEVELLTGW